MEEARSVDQQRFSVGEAKEESDCREQRTDALHDGVKVKVEEGSANVSNALCAKPKAKNGQVAKR